MGQLLLIPDPAQAKASCAMAERYHACFEYNDFYQMELLDDPAALRGRIALYRSLDRDTSRDTMHGAFLDITIHSEDPLIREISRKRVFQSMEVAKALGVRGIVFHTGAIATFFSRFYDENWLRSNREFWSSVAECFPDIEILMENMFDNRVELILSLAEELSDLPNFGICLDYSHAGIFGKDPARWVEKLAPYIRHLHINDHDGKADLHEAVGEGITDWKTFDRALRESKIDPSVLIEVRSLEKWERSVNYLSENGIFPFEKRK